MTTPNATPLPTAEPAPELAIDMPAVRAVRVYTTSPLPPKYLNLPPHQRFSVLSQGYNPDLEGQLLRLEDCPEGFAVWTGIETFCDMSNGLTLKLHPWSSDHIEAELVREGLIPGVGANMGMGMGMSMGMGMGMGMGIGIGIGIGDLASMSDSGFGGSTVGGSSVGGSSVGGSNFGGSSIGGSSIGGSSIGGSSVGGSSVGGSTLSPALREAVRRTLLLKLQADLSASVFGSGEAASEAMSNNAVASEEGMTSGVVAVEGEGVPSEAVVPSEVVVPSETVVPSVVVPSEVVAAGEAKPEEEATSSQVEDEVRRDSSMAR
ncbi:hypothetical protein B0A55_03712 [Friedmanniomyces simplex]|uniref:Uncharacterized protein n=1 Tax=Friedmanniomyces simplex TaxID=329884 RepID=A0A4U0XNI9_9PEZI|nr:hypothetical protein B0A55_03712 [Friedmanniomyces simplex]